MSVQVFISKHGDNYFVLEDTPSQFLFYFSEAHLLHFSYVWKTNKKTNQNTNHKTNKKKENILKDHYTKFIKAFSNL